jgi:hypothetical protein
VLVEDDPVKDVLRVLVNVTRGVSPTRSADAPRPADDGDNFLNASMDEDVAQRMHELKLSVADAIRSILNPVAEDDGRITFSIAGVEGFSVSTDSNRSSVQVGFRDTSFGSFALGSEPYSLAERSSAARTPRAKGGEGVSIWGLLFAVWDFVTHPLALFLIVIVVFVMVVLSLKAPRASQSH